MFADILPPSEAEADICADMHGSWIHATWHEFPLSSFDTSQGT